MMEGGGSEDVIKLNRENAKLKKTLKELTVDKNLMQEKLFRAFNKLLTTKKRKIKRLERSIKKLKGEAVLDEEVLHCDTCRCRNRNLRQRGRPMEVDQDEDADATIDAGSDYGSETDLDEDHPFSASPRLTTEASTSKKASRQVVSTAEKEAAKENPSTSENQPTSSSVTAQTKKTNKPEAVAEKEKEHEASQSMMSSQSSATDYEDMDDLVNELVS